MTACITGLFGLWSAQSPTYPGKTKKDICSAVEPGSSNNRFRSRLRFAGAI